MHTRARAPATPGLPAGTAGAAFAGRANDAPRHEPQEEHPRSQFGLTARDSGLIVAAVACVGLAIVSHSHLTAWPSGPRGSGSSGSSCWSLRPCSRCGPGFRSAPCGAWRPKSRVITSSSLTDRMQWHVIRTGSRQSVRLSRSSAGSSSMRGGYRRLHAALIRGGEQAGEDLVRQHAGLLRWQSGCRGDGVYGDRA
jgi:hypothetical protein